MSVPVRFGIARDEHDGSALPEQLTQEETWESLRRGRNRTRAIAESGAGPARGPLMKLTDDEFGRGTMK